MDYQTIKAAHVVLAVTSVALFVVRAVLSLRAVNWRQRWPVLRWLPHMVDTGLLLAGLSMLLWSQQYPHQQPWLAAKLMALLLYVQLGRLALRQGRPRLRRGWYLAGALACVFYIVLVAITKQMWPPVR